MTQFVEGGAELLAKLREMASIKEMGAAFREAVRKPMRDVEERARSNVSRVSPGQRLWHRTYKGNIVTRGYAASKIRLVVFSDRATKQKATAMLGVRPEAFYALNFQELGTSRIAARPWLVPAFLATRGGMVPKVGETIRARLVKIARKRSRGK